MANYQYDEAGNMAAYFLLTFLLVILIPFSIPSSSSSKRRLVPGCDCHECADHKSKLRTMEGVSIRRLILLSVGWAMFAFVAYKVSTTEVENKVYNPFEILGIRTSADIKEIKSHYKKLSRVLHPDKVKLGVNQTIESVEARFVEITKAYKSLTDETIRQNWERYGHPDGRQEVSMGIALPQWIVEGKNTAYVLGAYAFLFGVALPVLVGKWWFGNRQKTKDGVDARSASTFFKIISEDSGIDDIVGSLGKTYEWETPKLTAAEAELAALEKSIQEKLGSDKWNKVVSAAEAAKDHENRRKALVLLYAHFFRIPVKDSSLQESQAKLLLQTSTLVNALLSICSSRNWLVPTIAAIRFQAYLAQALPPGQDALKFAQLPGVSEEEAESLSKRAEVVQELLKSLEDSGDGRVEEFKKAVTKWGKLDLVDASFKVIDERIVTPSSIVFLVIKARMVPPVSGSSKPVPAVSEKAVHDEKRDYEFLNSKKDAEDEPASESKWAHAPRWPAYRKPAYWVILADAKLNRVVVPPMKISEIPYADAEHPDVYRSYKLQFQAPPNIQEFAWKVYMISDTFVGEEISRDITLKIDDPALLETEQAAEEDDISEPEEDSLAGQMAMMRGGAVKKRSEESDDESSTDDDRQSEDEGSSSDSD